MKEHKDSGRSFTTRFIPGLVVGLIVGGLSGAFIAPLVADRGESPTISTAAGDSRRGAGTPGHTDSHDRAPAPTETSPTETSPAETPKPGEPAPK